MALRIKGRGGHGLDQQEYDIFWTEFRAIEESRPPVPDEDHEEEPLKEPPGGMDPVLIHQGQCMLESQSELEIQFIWVSCWLEPESTDFQGYFTLAT